MNQKIAVVPVVMCGGSGTRLWPLSRTGFPKQFLALFGKKTLFQEAYLRLQQLNNDEFEIARTVIVTNEEQRFLPADQLDELSHPRDQRIDIVLEPQGKNTAPALTLAALCAYEDAKDPVLIMTPADQTVTDTKAFVTAIEQAIRMAHDNKIVILGIKPTSPETGYGYIEASGMTQGNASDVLRFVEKPPLEKAKEYVADGHFYWNSGIFVLRASLWLKALHQFRQDIHEAVTKAWGVRSTDSLRLRDPSSAYSMQFIRPDATLFNQTPAESIDYAVMERCPGSSIGLQMVQLDAGWNDLGSWDAVLQTAPHDQSGNAALGDALHLGTKNTLLISGHRMVAAVGVEDLIVVETPDAVLVTHRQQSQAVKALVAKLESDGRAEKNLHRKVARPWGWYDSVEEGEGFKVKRIMVKPGASLSLQQHAHRAEHWIVVKGQAQITNGEQTITLKENESTYIPKGQKHRLANTTALPLEIIEVQSGSYLGEDDIIRFDDQYGRA